MTPHELNLHIEAYGERRKVQSEDAVVQAYLTAYWQRVKRMPSLKEVLSDIRQKQQPKNDEQLLAQVRALNAAMGGDIRQKAEGQE